MVNAGFDRIHLGRISRMVFRYRGSSVEPPLPLSPEAAVHATKKQTARLSHASAATAAALVDTNEQAQGSHLATLELAAKLREEHEIILQIPVFDKKHRLSRAIQEVAGISPSETDTINGLMAT